jgi:hypothetical protein
VLFKACMAKNGLQHLQDIYTMYLHDHRDKLQLMGRITEVASNKNWSVLEVTKAL